MSSKVLGGGSMISFWPTRRLLQAIGGGGGGGAGEPGRGRQSARRWCTVRRSLARPVAGEIAAGAPAYPLAGTQGACARAGGDTTASPGEEPGRDPPPLPRPAFHVSGGRAADHDWPP